MHKKVQKRALSLSEKVRFLMYVVTDVTKVMYNVLMNRKMLAEASFLEKIT